jgi:hypothetical protein
VQVFLHNDIAAAGKVGIFVTDEYGSGRGRSSEIFGSVDESHQIAVIKVTEALHLVDRRNGISDASHDLRGHFEAKVHPFGPNVEQEVAWRRNACRSPA